MDKKIIYRYLKKQASKEEKEALLNWISENEENEKFFIDQMNLWILHNLPQKRAKIEDYEEIEKLLNKKKATKKITLDKRVIWSAAAVVLAMITLNIFLLSGSKTNKQSNSAIVTFADNLSKSNIPSKILYTDKGVKAKLILPDSSVVWLNSGSKIQYPDEFGKESRELSLSGEAYFDVVKDPDRPMIISNNKGFKVRVLGTRFNLKTYDNDDISQITLYSGKVEILRQTDNSNVSVTELRPNETLIINNDQTQNTSTIQDPESFAEWKEGKIVFSETKISEVIKVLERWHGVSFFVTNPQILDYRFSADFNSESIVQIMEYLKMTTFVNYKIEGSTVILKKR